MANLIKCIEILLEKLYNIFGGLIMIDIYNTNGKRVLLIFLNSK